MAFFAKNKKRILTFLAVLVVASVGIGVYQGVLAQESTIKASKDSVGGGWHILDLLSWVAYYLTQWANNLIGVIIGFLMTIISFNHFVDVEPVRVGWEIIRDLCNMGFVLIILIISIGTTLNIQSYNYRLWLPKLIIMAILINFSKAIAALFIDAGQILMLTFATAISNLNSGSFLGLIQAQRFFSIDFSNLTEEQIKNMHLSFPGVFATILLALVMSLVALIVIGAITLILTIRIVVIWILVILSPVAYLFSASPVGRQYASQWWQKFFQWVFTGPVMLFFVWLALLTTNDTLGLFFKEDSYKGVSVGIAGLGTVAGFGSFLIGIIFLMAALMAGQQLGGMAGRIAGWGYGTITQRVDRAGGWVRRKGISLGRTATIGAAGAIAGTTVSKLAQNKKLKEWLDKQAGKEGPPLLGRLKSWGAARTLERLDYVSEQDEKKAQWKARLAAKHPGLAAYNLRRWGLTPKSLAIKQEIEKITPHAEALLSFNLNKGKSKRFDEKSLETLYKRITSDEFDFSEVKNKGEFLKTLLAASKEDRRIRDYLKNEQDPQISALLTATNQQGMQARKGIKKFVENNKDYFGDEYEATDDYLKLKDGTYLYEARDVRKERLKAKAPSPAGGGGPGGAGGPGGGGPAGGSPGGGAGGGAVPSMPGSISQRELRKERARLRITSGINKVLREKNVESPAFYVSDLEKISGVKGATGLYYATPAQKKKIIPRLVRTAKQQGYSDSELKDLEKKLSQAKDIRLLQYGTGRDVYAHEAMHSRLEKVNEEKLLKIWKDIPEAIRRQIKEGIEQKWNGGREMPEKAVMKEYFADVLASGRETWASKIGSRPAKRVREELEKLGLRLGELRTKPKSAQDSSTKTTDTTFNKASSWPEKQEVSENKLEQRGREEGPAAEPKEGRAEKGTEKIVEAIGEVRDEVSGVRGKVEELGETTEQVGEKVKEGVKAGMGEKQRGVAEDTFVKDMQRNALLAKAAQEAAEQAAQKTTQKATVYQEEENKTLAGTLTQNMQATAQDALKKAQESFGKKENKKEK